MISISKEIEHIKERIDSLHSSKNILEEIKLCATIFILAFHCGRRIWKLLFKIKKNCLSEEKYYYWLSHYGLKKVISMNPYDHLESEQTRIEKEKFYS